MFTPDMSCMVHLQRFFISRLITFSLYFGRKVLQQEGGREKYRYRTNERHYNLWELLAV